jgi:hypothetical protein
MEAPKPSGAKNVYRSWLSEVKQTTVLPLPMPPVPPSTPFGSVDVSEEEKLRYKEDGAIVIRNVVSKEWIVYLQAFVENILRTSDEDAWKHGV